MPSELPRITDKQHTHNIHMYVQNYKKTKMYPSQHTHTHTRRHQRSVLKYEYKVNSELKMYYPFIHSAACKNQMYMTILSAILSQG